MVKLSNESLIEAVIRGEHQFGVFRPTVGWSEEPIANALLLAGSFRPLHRGHRALLKAGWEITGERLNPCFEISIRNVEKPEIATSDLARRLEQFQCPDDTIVITRAATFVEKARLLPGATFAIGYDTAVRLFDDRFYDSSDSGSPTVAALNELRSLGSSFVVGGRHEADGIFRTVSDLAIPDGLETLLLEIPEAKFSDPISSSDIRRSPGAR